MGIPDATKQSAADGVKSHVGGASTWISAHTGAGGVTGANEATGGGYARKQSVLTSGTTGIVNGAPVNVPVAAGTYTEGGMWTAATGGTFGGSAGFSGGSVVVSGTGSSIDITASIVSP
jgi:hypothetical protein